WLVSDASAVCGRAFPESDGAGHTDSSDEREQWKQSALWEQGGDALGAHATDQSAEGGCAGYARHQWLRGMWVEAFVEQRPERGDRDGSQHGGVQVEKHSRC